MEQSSAGTVVQFPPPTDPAHLAAGSSHANLAIRYWVGAGLSDSQIADQFRRLAVSLS